MYVNQICNSYNNYFLVTIKLYNYIINDNYNNSTFEFGIMDPRCITRLNSSININIGNNDWCNDGFSSYSLIFNNGNIRYNNNSKIKYSNIIPNIFMNHSSVNISMKISFSNFDKKHIIIKVNLSVGEKDSTVFTSDLSYKYVKINVAYN